MVQRPGALRSHRITVRDVTISVRTSRDSVPADRSPVILVHGLVISSRYMVPLARELAPDFRVYAPDLPGFGDSDKPRRTLSIADLADALADWMATSGLDRAMLAGNSFGCQILAEFATRHPERAERLVFLGPTVDAAARTFRRQLTRLAMNSRHEPRSLGPLSLLDYAKAGIPRALRTLRYSLEDRIEEKLPRITAPVLVVRGGRDPLVPQPWAEQVTSLLPCGRLVVIPGAAHTVNYNAPRQTARVMRPFLLGRAAVPRRPGPTQGRAGTASR